MILISAQGLGRQFSGDPIFSELEFEVRAGDRVGLVGPNGAGKTTLMQILAGLDQADYGNLFVRPGIRVSLLRQEITFSPEQTLIEVAKSGLASLLDLQHELEAAAQEMARGRGCRRPRTRHSAATTSSTARSSTRTPTPSITGSKKCSAASALAPPSSIGRRQPSPAASSRGSHSPSCCSKARTSCSWMNHPTISISPQPNGLKTTWRASPWP